MKEITNSSDLENTLKSNQLVIVDFTATWCGPCKRIKPILEKLSKEYDNVFFCAVDVDENKELMETYKISCMPTFLFFKGGKLVSDLSVSGADEKNITNSLIKLVQVHLSEL